MNKVEIDTFIETTGEFGDVWTIEQVQDVYGDKTLSDALISNMSKKALSLDLMIRSFLISESMSSSLTYCINASSILKETSFKTSLDTSLASSTNMP